MILDRINGVIDSTIEKVGVPALNAYTITCQLPLAMYDTLLQELGLSPLFGKPGDFPDASVTRKGVIVYIQRVADLLTPLLTFDPRA